MGEERTNSRLEAWRAWIIARAKGHPVPPEPPKRSSGPTPRLPEGWSEPEYQRRMCECCKLPVIGEIPLKENRWCGNCWTFRIEPERRRLRMIGGDLPPAA
jgi:hypothetical protein